MAGRRCGERCCIESRQCGEQAVWRAGGVAGRQCGRQTVWQAGGVTSSESGWQVV